MSAPNALQSTVKLYQNVIEEVVSNVKEAFLDEGVDEAVLQELKQIWESKVLATKVVDTLNPAAVQQAAPVSTTKSTQNTSNNNSSQQQQQSSSNSGGNSQSGSKQTQVQSQQQQQQRSNQQRQQQLATQQESSQQQPVRQNQQQQQQQNVRSTVADLSQTTIHYNPGPQVRACPAVPSLIQQHVPPAAVAASTIVAPPTVLTQNPMAAAAAAAGLTIMRGLPQSVIMNANAHGNVFMQLPGVPGTSIRMIGPQIPTISAISANASSSVPTISAIPTLSSIPTISSFPGISATAGLPPSLMPVVPQQRQPTTTKQQDIVRPQAQHPFHHQGMPHLSMAGSNVIVIPQNSGGSSSSSMKDNKKVVIQLDGPGTLSDDDDEDILEDEDDIVPEDDEEEPAPLPVDEGDALNSEDDEKSSENADEMFEADDVIVCQFEKVNRIRNKWKFVLKDGIINLGRKDYVFNKAIGEAEF